MLVITDLVFIFSSLCLARVENHFFDVSNLKVNIIKKTTGKLNIGDWIQKYSVWIVIIIIKFKAKKWNKQNYKW